MRMQARPRLFRPNAQGKGGLVNIYDPSWVVKNPSVITVHSKTYSLVTHLPSAWRKNLPGNLDVSLIYDKSENFNPDSSRHDIFGNQVENPSGSTKEYGVAINALDGKLSLKVMHYETKVQNATLGQFRHWQPIPHRCSGSLGAVGGDVLQEFAGGL